MGFNARRIVFAFAAMSCIAASAWAEPVHAPGQDGAATAGVWVQKQADFQYRAFTARYTCDGLRDRMRAILLQLGARSDMQVLTYGCMHSVSPEALPSVRIKMSVLEPAAGDATNSVAARWQNVDLQAGRDPAEFAGDCELLQQLRQHVLPLFATRNVVANTTCVPRAAIIGSTKLTADVLVAEASPKSAAR